MTQQLREELHRLGDRAPDLSIPADLWSRGRRARARGRALTLAAAAALVAVVAGIGWALPPTGEVAPADQDRGGVPSYVEAVPGHLQGRDPQDRWTGPVESDLALGTGALAFVTGGGLPVVVTLDGDYHLLDLPGFLGNSLATSTGFSDQPTMLSLSPDGTRLAWAWVELPGRTDYTPAPSGVRIADLATGEVQEIVLTGERSVAVSSLVWSHDSGRLAWHGASMGQWNESGSSWRGFETGVIGPGTRSTRVGTVSRAEYIGIAVDDSGLVTTVGENGKVAVWDGPTISADAAGGDGWGVAPRGATSQWGTTLFGGRLGDAPRTVSSDGRTRPRPLAPDVFAQGADTEPLGWIDEDHAVVVARERGGGGILEPHVAIMSVPGGPTSTYRIVTRVEAHHADTRTSIDQLSVAVDLMTLDRPTVDPVEQSWPWSTERKVGVAALGLLGALALGALAVALRRLW